MNRMVIHYGLTTEQASLLGAALPEEYELTTAECVTDLIVTNAVCSIIDTSQLDANGEFTLIAYALDVGDQMDGTMVWLGGVEPPALSSFVCCDSFLDMMTELDSILDRAQARYDAMQMYGGEYAYLPKHAIEESLEADIYSTLYRKYGEKPDSVIIKRMRQEWTALLESGNVVDLAAVYELTRWLKRKQHPYKISGDATSSFIPYLLGITNVNPLPPHLCCPECQKVIWRNDYKDGFDIPPDVCPKCGGLMQGDGHNLVWQEYASYGRVPTYVFYLPYDMKPLISNWLENHWLRKFKGNHWTDAQPHEDHLVRGNMHFYFGIEPAAVTEKPKLCREDVFHYLKKHGFEDKDAFRGMCSVEKGKGFPVITEEMRTAEDRAFLQQVEATKSFPSQAWLLERMQNKMGT